MMEFEKNGSRLANVLIVIYFIIAVAEIVAELFLFKPLIVLLKPSMPLILVALYYFTSPRRDNLFFAAMFLSSITNALFIPGDMPSLRLGLIVFTAHRVLVIILIFKALKLKDYIPVIIGTVPFMIVFFYMLASSDVPDDTFIIMVIQNVLISIIGGVALSNYMMNDNRKNSWLLICGLLFVGLQFIVFIEKYYLTGFTPSILRPVAMGLNAFAFYTFYEFIMAIERSDDNGATR